MYDSVLSIYNVIQSDDSYCVTPFCRRGFVSVVIIGAVASDKEVGESGATVVSHFVTRNPLKQLSRDYGH